MEFSLSEVFVPHSKESAAACASDCCSSYSSLSVGGGDRGADGSDGVSGGGGAGIQRLTSGRE